MSDPAPDDAPETMVGAVARRGRSPDVSTDAVTFDIVDPRSAEATWAMGQYFAELDERFPGGFDPGDALEADAHQYEAPTGAFVVARLDDDVVGCGGVQTIADEIGEIKRMWVSSSVRGRGLGRRLLSELEERSRSLGHRTVRLDTNSNLAEAVAMYRRTGYVDIERYNDNPYPDHWFEKPLV